MKCIRKTFSQKLAQKISSRSLRGQKQNICNFFRIFFHFLHHIIKSCYIFLSNFYHFMDFFLFFCQFLFFFCLFFPSFLLLVNNKLFFLFCEGSKCEKLGFSMENSLFWSLNIPRISGEYSEGECFAPFSFCCLTKLSKSASGNKNKITRLNTLQSYNAQNPKEHHGTLRNLKKSQGTLKNPKEL